MEENNNRFLYYLKTGKKYHFYNCSYIRGKELSKISINNLNNYFEKLCSKCRNRFNISKIKEENKPYNSNENSNNKYNFAYLNNNNYNFENHKNTNYFNNKDFKYNNQIFEGFENNRNNNKDFFNIINNDDEDDEKEDEKEDKKMNNKKKEKSPEHKEKFSDFSLSVSDLMKGGDGISLNQRSNLEEKSSELDFNNNIFSTKNKNNPFSLNDIGKISQYDNQNNLKNINFIINKNVITKVDQIKNKNRLNNNEEVEDSEIKEKNKTKKTKIKPPKLNLNSIIVQSNDTENIIKQAQYQSQNLSNSRKNSESRNLINKNISIEKDEYFNILNSRRNFINADSSNSIFKTNEESKNNNYNYNSDINAKTFIINEPNSSISSSMENHNIKLYNQNEINALSKDDIDILKETYNKAKKLILDNPVFHSINTTGAFTNLNDKYKIEKI